MNFVVEKKSHFLSLAWCGRWQHELVSTTSSTSWAFLSLRHLRVHWPDYATAGDNIVLIHCPSVESSSNRRLAFQRGLRLRCLTIQDTVMGLINSGSVNFGLLIRKLIVQHIVLIVQKTLPSYHMIKALNPLSALLKC